MNKYICVFVGCGREPHDSELRPHAAVAGVRGRTRRRGQVLAGLRRRPLPEA